MEFLRSAVSSAISKGPPFPYTFGDRVDVDNSIWSLYNGTRKVSTRGFAVGLVELLLKHSRKTGRTAAYSHLK